MDTVALLRAEAREAQVATAFLQVAKLALRDASADLEINGPLPAPMPRRAGYQRAQLVLSSPDRRGLHGALDAALPAIHAAPEARKVRWSLDVDPLDLY
jgi:primosomal protein N' (replication factor Y)